MKKSLSVILTVCLFVSSCFVFTSCVHECSFSSEWSFDDDFHWNVCTVSDCEEISNKAEHIWNDGEITTKATQENEGVKTFTCDTCSATKTEAVEFTGLTLQEWNLTLSESIFKNFTYTEISTSSASGVSMVAEARYKFTEDNAWVYMSAMGASNERYAPDVESANSARNQLLASINDIANHAYFEYDAATKSYKAVCEILIAALNAYSNDVTLKFENDRLVEITYSVSIVQSGVTVLCTSVITISDYGTTVLPSPAKF